MKVRTIFIAVAAVSLPIAGSAQTVWGVHPVAHSAVPAVYRTNAVRPKGKWHPIKIGPHTFYGMITVINGTTLTMRTRKHRLVNVDATNVLADGSYSAPLFVGKLVTIDGTQSTNGVFTAAHIFRMTNLNALPDDH